MNNNIIELELPKVDFDVADLQDKYKNGLLKDILIKTNSFTMQLRRTLLRFY